MLSTISSAYRVRNKKKIKKVFKVVFTLEYTGQEVPTGFCSDLEIEACEWFALLPGYIDMRGSRGVKNHKNMVFLSNTGPYPMKVHKAI